MVNGKVVGYKPYKCHGGILTLPIGVALEAKNKGEKINSLKKYKVNGS